MGARKGENLLLLLQKKRELIAGTNSMFQNLARLHVLLGTRLLLIVWLLSVVMDPTCKKFHNEEKDSEQSVFSRKHAS
jgi:hypothetical protein